MAGNLTDYLELALLEHSTGRAEFTKPTATYAGLFLVAPTDSAAGTEVSAADYDRIEISWGAAASGAIANDAEINFGSASSNWGTIVALGILDQLTTGNLLWYGTLGNTVTINSADSYKISTGGLTLALN